MFIFITPGLLCLEQQILPKVAQTCSTAGHRAMGESPKTYRVFLLFNFRQGRGLLGVSGYNFFPEVYIFIIVLILFSIEVPKLFVVDIGVSFQNLS